MLIWATTGYEWTLCRMSWSSMQLWPTSWHPWNLLSSFLPVGILENLFCFISSLLPRESRIVRSHFQLCLSRCEHENKGGPTHQLVGLSVNMVWGLIMATMLKPETLLRLGTTSNSVSFLLVGWVMEEFGSGGMETSMAL